MKGLTLEGTVVAVALDREHRFKIGPAYHNQFDLVVVTASALAFTPDLTACFRVAHRLLPAGG
jgi:hypothetical protein